MSPDDYPACPSCGHDPSFKSADGRGALPHTIKCVNPQCPRPLSVTSAEGLRDAMELWRAEVAKART